MISHKILIKARPSRPCLLRSQVSDCPSLTDFLPWGLCTRCFLFLEWHFPFVLLVNSSSRPQGLWHLLPQRVSVERGEWQCEALRLFLQLRLTEGPRLGKHLESNVSQDMGSVGGPVSGRDLWGLRMDHQEASAGQGSWRGSLAVINPHGAWGLGLCLQWVVLSEETSGQRAENWEGRGMNARNSGQGYRISQGIVSRAISTGNLGTLT